MQPPNVYSIHYRFCDVRDEGNLLWIPRETSSTVKIQPSPGGGLRRDVLGSICGVGVTAAAPAPGSSQIQGSARPPRVSVPWAGGFRGAGAARRTGRRPVQPVG